MSLWHSIQNLGIRSDTPPFEVRNTRLVIYICLTSVATTAFYGALFLSLGNGLSAAINFGIATFFLTPLLLLRQGKTAWSKALLILGINGGTLLAIMVYGDDFRNELFFVVSAMLGSIVFKPFRPGLLAFCTSLLFYALSILYTQRWDAWIAPDPALIRPLHVLGLISVATIAYVLMEYIRRETRRHEGRILEAKSAVELEKQNALESLHYAASIQKAILGDKQAALTGFVDGFVLFKPKDFVSGDFFWSGEADGVRILAAADCTGHGVPAALMTILGHGLLQEIVYQEQRTNARDILQRLDERVTEKLSRKGQRDLQDGMDIAIVAIHLSGGALQFAGANSAMHLVRQGEMTTHRGSRSPIGSNLLDAPKAYSATILPFEPGDRVYLASDGFQDQFGGPHNKKYLRKRFRQLLVTSGDDGLSLQKAKLEAEFQAWKGPQEQTDDVLVMGIQL